MNGKLVAFASLAVALLVVLPSFSAPEAPAISSYLVDRAGIFDSETSGNFETALRALEKETAGVQFVVFIDRKMPKGTSVEEYSLSIAEKNRIGKAGKDNGILLYVAIEDREYRWEVGYGVESTLSAPLLGRVSRDYLLPDFKEGNYALGILKATDAVGKILLNSTDPDIVRMKEEAKADLGWDPIDTAIIVVFLLVVGGMFLSFVFSAIALARDAENEKGPKGKRKYLNAASLIFLPSYGSWGGKGGFGGGGGGGLGGFSGGGGSFGGGGFSGKW